MAEALKPKLRLIIQGSIPIEDIIEGEELYRQLKVMLQSYTEQITFNGQITKILEPCCREQQKGSTFEKVPQTTK